jgi:hypothetical protein
MTSDDEEFNDTVESHTPDRKTQDPGDRFLLRQTPARVESEKKKMENQNLFESLSRRSAETSSAGAFSYGNFKTAEPNQV